MGMLRALARTDLRPDLVVGTSVGALNGAVLAADPARAVQRLAALWPHLTRADVFPGGWVRGLRTLTETRSWIYDNQPLTDLLTGSLATTTFEGLQLPLVAVATEFPGGALAELDHGDLRSALLASAAIPGVFPWVERDGRRLVDGVLVANVPVTVALRRGARSLVVLDCGLAGVGARAEGTIVEVLNQSAAIFARRQIAADLQACAELPVLWLGPDHAHLTNQLDFTATARLVDEGEQAAGSVLDGLESVHSLPPGVYGAPAELGTDERIRTQLR